MFKRIIAIICAVLSFFGIPVGGQELSNPDASAEAIELYSYICDVYGEYIISGQQESTWVDGEQYEFEYIYENIPKFSPPQQHLRVPTIVFILHKRQQN